MYVILSKTEHGSYRVADTLDASAEFGVSKNGVEGVRKQDFENALERWEHYGKVSYERAEFALCPILAEHYVRYIALGKTPDSSNQNYVYHLYRDNQGKNTISAIGITPKIEVQKVVNGEAAVVLRFDLLPDEVPEWCEVFDIDHSNTYGAWSSKEAVAHTAGTYPRIVGWLDSQYTRIAGVSDTESIEIKIPRGIKVLEHCIDSSLVGTFGRFILAKVTVPDTVVQYGACFDHIIFDEGSKVFSKNLRVMKASSGLGAFSCCDFSRVPNAWLPIGLERIPMTAFAYCKGMQNILTHLPGTIKVIEGNAFSFEDGAMKEVIDEIRLPMQIQEIGSSAFQNVNCKCYILPRQSKIKLGLRAFTSTQVTGSAVLKIWKGTTIIIGRVLDNNKPVTAFDADSANLKMLALKVGVAKVEVYD